MKTLIPICLGLHAGPYWTRSGNIHWFWRNIEGTKKKNEISNTETKHEGGKERRNLFKFTQAIITYKV
jgi:hypothetical protein